MSPPGEHTLADAARAAATDPAVVPQLAMLCTRIGLQRDPEGLRGSHALEFARTLGAPVHVVVATIAQLTGRDVTTVAHEIRPADPEPDSPASAKQQRAECQRARQMLAEREAPKATGDADLDQLIASMPGGFMVRAAARLLVEPLLGARDPDQLRAWERQDIVSAVDVPQELVDDALELLAAIRSRPHIRSAWERWHRELEPAPDTRHASPPPGPPDRRVRHPGERTLGELRRRIRNAREIPVPRVEALRWPVIRDRNAKRDPDTGLYEFRDMLGDVACTFKPSVRYLRLMTGCALLLREADHWPNPTGEGRRTVFTSYNTLHLAATGRDAQHEEYDVIDAFIAEMEIGHLEATDLGADKRSTDYSLRGTILESASILLEGGQVMALTSWRALPEGDRPARRRGPGPTLMLTFTEPFYTAVMKRAGHFLLSKQVAWAARDELVTLLRIESHTGLRRTPNCWEHFMAPPFLRQLGFHGSDQRASELLVEDDLHAIDEVWDAVSSVVVGDGKKGYAWAAVNLDRRGESGRRRELQTRRTRTRQQRQEARAVEHPERIGRRRTFARAGTPGRESVRRAVRARKLQGLVPPVQPRSRKRQNARQRARVQGDLDAAAQAREAA
jgi:hypothetical protein